MNGPAWDEGEVEDRLETRMVFERLVEEARLRGDGITVLRDYLRRDTARSERRVQFRKFHRTLERRGPDSPWAMRQLRVLRGGASDDPEPSGPSVARRAA